MLTFVIVIWAIALLGGAYAFFGIRYVERYEKRAAARLQASA